MGEAVMTVWTALLSSLKIICPMQFLNQEGEMIVAGVMLKYMLDLRTSKII